jgi:hypothetical protein
MKTDIGKLLTNALTRVIQRRTVAWLNPAGRARLTRDTQCPILWRSDEKGITIIVVLVACVVLTHTATMNLTPVFAQAPTTGNLSLRTSVAEESYQALRQVPVMVSVVKDGQVVKQMELGLNANTGFELPAGLYDVRVEGDGMQTLVKRGIHVMAGGRTDMIAGPMRAGQGVKIVEYATGGLSREEMAARLQKLEATVAELLKARQSK